VKLAVGVDVAKGFHWASAVDERGAEVLSRRVDNDPGSIEALLEELVVHAAGETFAAGVDVMGGIASLVVVMFQEAGVEVLHVPGLAVNRARQGTVGGENKSDPRDARVIAEQVRTRQAELRPVEIEDEATAELRLLVGHRRDLVADQTRRLSRLHDLVVSVHPGLERALDLGNKADLWLLTRYVTPGEIRERAQPGCWPICAASKAYAPPAPKPSPTSRWRPQEPSASPSPASDEPRSWPANWPTGPSQHGTGSPASTPNSKSSSQPTLTAPSSAACREWGRC
jgi:hypothetical protein